MYLQDVVWQLPECMCMTDFVYARNMLDMTECEWTCESVWEHARVCVIVLDVV